MGHVVHDPGYLGRIASFIPSVSDREGLTRWQQPATTPGYKGKNNYYFPTRYCDSRPAPQLDNHTGKQSLDRELPIKR